MTSDASHSAWSPGYGAAFDQVVTGAQTLNLGPLVNWVHDYMAQGLPRDTILRELCLTTMHQPPMELASALAKAILLLAEQKQE
jgi:hypothetical protein